MEKDKIEYYIRLMDEYLAGGLDQAKVDDLKAAVASNPFLKDLLKTQTEARANIRIAAEAALKQKLLSRFEPIEEDKPTSKFALKYVFLAIAILSLIGLGYLLFQTESDITESKPQFKYPSELAMIDAPNIDVARSMDTTALSSTWQAAVTAFNTNNYKECIMLLDKIKSDSVYLSKHQGKYNLIFGVSQLKLENFTEAHFNLQKINADNPYHDQAIWYDALASFYNNEIVDAKDKLDIVAQDSTHYKQAHAQQFLEQLQ